MKMKKLRTSRPNVKDNRATYYLIIDAGCCRVLANPSGTWLWIDTESSSFIHTSLLAN